MNLKHTVRTRKSETCIMVSLITQPQNNIENDERGDLIGDPHSILNGWRNHVSQLLNVHGGNDVR